MTLLEQWKDFFEFMLQPPVVGGLIFAVCFFFITVYFNGKEKQLELNELCAAYMKVMHPDEYEALKTRSQ